MAKESNLSLDDAAAHLGVHYQTAYRWVRAGKLRATKVGGRYRVASDDLLAFEEQRSKPEGPPSPSDVRLGRQRRAMIEALFAGDETKVMQIADTLTSNGTSVTRLIEEVLAPPLAEIGQAWRQGAATIFVEHRASAIVERVLGRLSPNPRGRRRGVALVAGVAGDRHSLPTLMATVALREDRWTVQHLGADVPVDELVTFIEGHKTDLVVLSAVGPGAVDRARQAEANISEQVGVPVLVGQPGASLSHLQSAARGLPAPDDGRE
ncbi:MAG: helix-turn-helix domain-containing protein [Actinomycetota bacterium]